MIKPGDKVKDVLTGFSGVAVCRGEWLYGCVRIAIQAEQLDKDGKPIEPEWFDEQRVELLREEAPQVSQDSRAKTGGPQKDPRW